MEEKLIRDALGSPVPQHYNEELDMFTVNTLDGSTVTNGVIDFSQTKLLRDRLGSVIPQVWDTQNQKWVVVTTQNAGGGGEGGPVTWEGIQGKPTTFPSTIAQIEGLQDELDTVFQQVSSGKSLLETSIKSKGGAVAKAGEIPTFQELQTGILAIEGMGSNTRLLSQNEYNLLTDAEKNNGTFYFIKE